MTEYSAPPPDRQPGWRTDPWFTGQYRWWDGSGWSGDVFPEGVGPYGHGTVVTERPPGQRPPEPPPWQPAAPAPPPPAWVIGGLEQPPPPPLPVETIEQGPPRRRLSSTAILALLLVFGIALGTTIGLLIPHHSSKSAASLTPTPSPSTQPSPTPSPTVVPFSGLLQRFSLRQSDLPSSQQLALIPDGDTVNAPTLDLCNGTYPSESRRVARLQLSGETSDGSVAISSEAVLYDSASGTTQAFTELQKVAKSCPSTPVDSPVGEPTVTTKFGARPDANWPTVAGVQRLAYTITTTDDSGQASTSTVIYLRRGKALLGLYLPKPDPGGPTASVQGKTSAADITAIFEQRLADVPASAIGA